MASTATTTDIKDAAGATKNVRDPVALGATTADKSLPVAIATNDAVIGATSETAPSSDVAPSGLNGRLQRIAQNISTLIGKLPSTIGRKVSSNSLSVAMASDDPLVAKTQLFATVTAVQATPWVKVRDRVALQVAGSGTAVTLQMQRSTQDPTGTPNTAPVDGPISGNPSTGMQVLGWSEPGVAWWRANVTAVTGTVTISIDGGAA